MKVFWLFYSSVWSQAGLPERSPRTGLWIIRRYSLGMPARGCQLFCFQSSVSALQPVLLGNYLSAIGAIHRILFPWIDRRGGHVIDQNGPLY